MKYCSISQAAATLHIPESTLRYYEKKGLLPLMERDAAGRRLFSEHQMALIEAIICLKNSHMPISHIKQYMDWIMEGKATLEPRLEMLLNHKQNMIHEIQYMTELLEKIEVKIERYQKQIQEE